MRINRTLPPAAAPIPIGTILSAIPACLARTGQDLRNIEKGLADYFNSTYCFLVSSGKAALYLTLSALKECYPERDQVLIPAFTCYSVPAAIKRAGLQIKLCDLAPSSLDFDRNQLKEIVAADKDKKKILCVLPTHLFGCPADLFEIQKIVGPADIPIVEDAAQAMGEEVKGKKLGTLGDVGFFSLGRGKAVSTLEGGIILTSRPDLGKKIQMLIEPLPEYGKIDALRMAVKALATNLLLSPSLFWLPKALPFISLGETIYDQSFPVYTMCSFQRQLALEWLDRLCKHRQARMHNIQSIYRKLPQDLFPHCAGTEIGGMIRLPLFARNSSERSTLIELSEKFGLGFMPTYPTTVDEISELAGEFPGQDYPQAKEICRHLFTVPVHELLNRRDIKEIIRILLQTVG